MKPFLIQQLERYALRLTELDFLLSREDIMGDMTQSSRAAESQMTSVVQGQGNLIDVVTAISSAEASLETVMAVRDQVIQAYQEIMRMPI
jgi:flagellar hook-basal body complex protein FliE